MQTGKANTLVICVVMATLVATGFSLWKVIIPGYREESNRTYASRFGYPALNRKLGRPFPVKCAVVEKRTLSSVEMGEGILDCDRVVASIVPEGSVVAILVHEGDRVKKGQVLMEIDDTIAKADFERAQLTLNSAKADLERVKGGSPVSLTYERPEKAAIRLEVSRRQIDLLKEEDQIRKAVVDEGLLSKLAYLDSQMKMADLDGALKADNFNLSMATRGRDDSIGIAENRISSAVQSVQVAAKMLQQCKLCAPADGIVERLLVHEGEYHGSQPIQAACVIAAGLWFEAHLDQRSMGMIKVGDKAEIELEALHRPIAGLVTHVIPVVTFSNGGPDLQQPVRPLGTGAPEWPATYRVQIGIPAAEAAEFGPGLTGFARFFPERIALAAPQSAITSVSAGQGIIHLLEDSKVVSRQVDLGIAGNGWIEVKAGVHEGEKVLVEGYQDLEKSDRVQEIPIAIASPH
jgi:HlyD family secretion protein